MKISFMAIIHGSADLTVADALRRLKLNLLSNLKSLWAVNSFGKSLDHGINAQLEMKI